MSLLVICSVLSLAVSAFALPLQTNTDTVYIQDQYLVQFTPQRLRTESVESHYEWLESQLAAYKDQSRLTDPMSDSYRIMHKYNISSYFIGYSAVLPPSIASIMTEMPNIASIELDSVVQLTDIQNVAGTWGLSRVGQRNLPLKPTYVYPNKAGAGVTVYVIDTGVSVEHPDFEGRASWGQTFSKDGFTDGSGHGTHCAGTVASATYGVAKKATIIGVKVLDNSGSGSFANVIAGIDWTVQHAIRNNLVGKAVASMSLGGGKTQTVNDAVAAAVKAGIPFAIAAGNNFKADACNTSPASEPLAYTVAASDINDKLARFSNVGKCVDIIAPGVDIKSTWINNSTNTISGTSMATPNTAGVMALVLAEKKFAKPQDLYAFLTSNATPKVIQGVPAGTVNLLVFNANDLFASAPVPTQDQTQQTPTQGDQTQGNTSQIE